MAVCGSQTAVWLLVRSAESSALKFGVNARVREAPSRVKFVF